MKSKKQFVSIIFITLLIIAIVILAILLKSRVDSAKSIENLQSIKEDINLVTSSSIEEVSIIEGEDNGVSDEIEDNTEAKQIINNIEKNPYATLFEANSDYVGWIEIENTAISYPILKGKDNGFYLDRGFDKAYDTRGSIFMDYRNFGQGFDQHTILYGHNMKDGSMFGELQAYKDPEFMEDNPYIILEDLYEKRTFKIISVYYDKADPELLQLQFKEGIEAYVMDLAGRSDYEVDTEGLELTTLLTLVTCSYEVDDGRYFLHAIEINRLD